MATQNSGAVTPKKQYPFSVSHRDVWAIAGPTAIAFSTTPLLGITDMTVIGRLGQVELLGGLILGALAFDFIAAIFNFLRTGTTGLTAQAVGAKDPAAQVTQLYRALLIAAVLGFGAIILQKPIEWVALKSFAPSAETAHALHAYFAIRIYAMPLSLGNYALLGWFLGRGSARLGLMLQVLLNVINISLSVFLVLYAKWGIEGVAIATVTAELVGFGAGLFVALRTVKGLDVTGFPPVTFARVVARAAMKRLIVLNGNILIRSIMLMLMFSFFIAQGSRSGDMILAANGLLMNFMMVSIFFLDGIAMAAEQICGKAVGANYRPAFMQALRLTNLWGLVIGALLSVAIWFSGPVIIDFMTTSDVVRQGAREYLIWAALVPLAGAVAFNMDGAFTGATWDVAFRNSSFIASAEFFATWAIFATLYGNHGLWLTLVLNFVVRGIILYGFLPGQLRRTFKD